MNIFVFYRSHSAPSARVLHETMKIQAPKHLIIRGRQSSRFLRSRKYDCIVNVGNSLDIPNAKNTRIINPPQNVRLSTNKRLARARFKAKGISAPKLWLKWEDIPKKEFPVVGRISFHTKGKGFWYCRDTNEARRAASHGATHFLKFIKNTREFRAHVFATTLDPKGPSDYIIAKLAEKTNSGEADTEVIKNHEHGYVFLAPKQIDDTTLSAVRTLSKEALFKFGLHYGGVDVMYSQNTGRSYILEINTTPCLTDENANTNEVYARKLLTLAGVNLNG